MQITTGKVVNGRIIVDDDEPLPEGAEVWIEVIDQQMELTPEEDAELAERDAEIDRGEFLTLEEFLNGVRR